jgi:PAS domain S-box-containing protein
MKKKKTALEQTPRDARPRNRNPSPKTTTIVPPAHTPTNPRSDTENVLSILFANNPLPMWVYDLETLAFLEVNHAATERYGYSRDEFLAMRITDIRPPEDVPRLQTQVAQTRPALQHSHVWRHRLKNGQIIQVDITSHVLDFAGRKAALVVAQDVTERIRAEEHIRQLAAIVESSDDAILSKSLEGIILSWNRGAEKIYGYSAEQVIGQPVSILMPPERQYEMLEHLARIRDGMQVKSFETERVRKDGVRIMVSITLSPIQNERGEVIAVSAIERDITERKQSEAKLRTLFELERNARAAAEQAQKRLAFLAEASALMAETFDYRAILERVARIAVPVLADWCAIDVIEADGSLQRVAVVHSNPAKEKMAYELQRKYPSDPNAPRGIHNVLRTGKSEIYAELSDAFLAATVRDAAQLELLQQLGVKSVMLVPFQARGQNFGVITLAMAESGRRYTDDDLALVEGLARRAALLIENARLYAEAQKLNAELEQRVHERTTELQAINQELEAFTYSVSHDLRAPLRHISGYVELLSRSAPPLDEKSQRYLNTISASAARMGMLIDDLLTFSRMGRADMQKSQVNAQALVQEVLQEMDADMAGREIEWQIDALPHTYGDRAMLKIVYANLIANALKFTRPRVPARIEVGFDASNPHETIFYVRDNGVGFDMQYRDKLFGIFQRLHRAEDFEGTGVGLANVRRIIHRHGGRTWAEGELDRGATFYFSLPKHKRSSHE